jgi:hypothetical protein
MFKIQKRLTLGNKVAAQVIFHHAIDKASEEDA